MKKFAVIFDMDGVISHTNPYHADAFKEFFKKYGVAYTDQELIDHMYGKHNSYIMEYFFKRKISLDELSALENEKEALFREIYQHDIKPINGFLELLSELKTAGFLTGVATSAPRANLDLIMDGLGFAPSMESILASEDVDVHKPNPEVYLKSAANLGVAPSDCIVFEDSFSGVTAAINAGTKVIGVLSSHAKDELPPCQHYIHDYIGLDVAFIKRLVGA